MLRRLLFLPAFLLIAACGSTPENASPPSQASRSDAVTAVPSAQIRPLHQVGSLYVGGQPSLDGFQSLQDLGVSRLINLRYDGETPGFDEAIALSEAGFDYQSVPWNGPAELDDQVFGAVRQLLRESDQPAMLYCKSSNRAGAVWLPYRVLDQGVPLDQALNEARQIGMRTPQYERRALQYIEANR